MAAASNVTTPDTVKRAPDLTLSRNLARLTDDLITIPGTNFGIGLDAVVGLLPGIGDGVGALMSSAILADAVRCRVKLRILALMGWNLLFDAVLGLLPFIGDLADVAHRANRKNYRLLEAAVAEGRLADVGARGYVFSAVSLVVLIMAVLLACAVLAIWALLKVLGLV